MMSGVYVVDEGTGYTRGNPEYGGVDLDQKDRPLILSVTSLQYDCMVGVIV